MKIKIVNKNMLGQAMTEFIIIIPVLILLIFGAIQFGFIYSAKTTLNYATFQSARLAAVNHGNYRALRRGLIRGLAPLYTHDDLDDNEDAIKEGMQNAADEVDNFTRIIRISPSTAQFSGSWAETDDDGNRYIPNDNLMFREDSAMVDGASIQDANLLKIRVEYCYKLMVPIVNKIIGSLSELNNTRPTPDNRMTDGDPRFADTNINAVGIADYNELCGSRADEREGFVIFSESIVRMQSQAMATDPEDTEDFAENMCDGDKMLCL